MALTSDFLLEWADDEFMAGHALLSELDRYLDIEEVVALASIGQDENAHAHELYGFVEKDDRERDRLVFLRPPAEFRAAMLPVWPVDTFEALVVKHFLYDVADEARVKLLSEHHPEAGSLRRLLEREEEVHRRHWMGWLLVLVGLPSGADRLRGALDYLFAGCEGVFTSRGLGEDVLDALADDWESRVRRCLDEIELDIPADLARMARCGGRGVTDRIEAVVGLVQSVPSSDPSAVWG